MSQHRVDRRSHRSDVPSEALMLFLRHVADRHDAQLLALADADGLLLSGVGASNEELTTLAALSTLTPSEPERRRQPMGVPSSWGKLRSTCFNIGNNTFRLAAVGAQPLRSREVAEAVARILG